MPFLLVLLLTLLTACVAGQEATFAVPASKVEKANTFQSHLSDKEVEDLFVLGKLWGFLKYHHPAVATGKYDWDKELIRFLPSYGIATDKAQRNDSLLAWINRLGEVAACDSCKDSTFKNLALRPDLSWIKPSAFSKELAEKLLYIKANRQRGDQYYVRFLAEEDIHFASFEHENSYGAMAYPSPEYRLLALFRYWNIIEYWYPYKYNLGQDWDAVLKKMIPLMIGAGNGSEYSGAIQQLVATIQDSHAVVQSKTITEDAGRYYMPFTLKFIEQKAVIVSIINDTLAKKSGIMKGDILESVDGVSVKALIDKKRPLIAASNNGSFLNIVRSLLTKSRKETNELTVRRAGKFKKLTAYNYFSKSMLWIKPGTFSLERDSSFCMIGDSIGYINLGNFQRKDSLKLRALAQRVKGLIIDNRQYPKTLSAGDLISNIILPSGVMFAKFSSPTPGYPGLFPFSTPTEMGIAGGDHYFRGMVAILINEETQSSTEFQAMIFRMAPKAVLIGSNTAGADGNVALINLPGGIATYISGLGVYYPDGRETQRIGIVPDIVVHPTIKGFLDNRDELLEKAVSYIRKDK
jgi:C-terminal processing protease CtpA/Prc